MSTKMKVVLSSLVFISVTIILSITIISTIARGEDVLLTTTTTTNDLSDIRFRQPNIGDITEEGDYPDPKGSEDSEASSEKAWYEYIIYSTEPKGVFSIDLNTQVVYYDPYDYSYGMIMEIDETIVNTFTTSNQITFTYTNARSVIVEDDNTTTYDTGFSAGVETSVSAFGQEVSVSADVSLNITKVTGTKTTIQNDTSTEISLTYDAVYFNSQGVPYSWRIVKYTVYLPVYIQEQHKINGEWVTANEGYLLIPTIQGICREWRENNGTYFEDWATGEPVAEDDFWESFLTKNSLIKAYQDRLIPNMGA